MTVSLFEDFLIFFAQECYLPTFIFRGATVYRNSYLAIVIVL